jgi:outer membrane lipoprotein-sorting protein
VAKIKLFLNLNSSKMKSIFLSLIVLTFFNMSVSAQQMDMTPIVSQLQSYLDGVEENATIVISDEGVVTYTKRFGDQEND